MDKELPVIIRFPNYERDQSTNNSSTPKYNQDHWFYALKEIRKSLFTNTSATISSPFSHLSNYERKTNSTLFPPSYYQLFADIDRQATTFSFNSESFAAHDIFIYRQLRSEHLVMRMAHQVYLEKPTYTFCRLSRGIFMVQKYQHSEPMAFQPKAIAGPFKEKPINTFTFDVLYNDMMQQTQQQPQTRTSTSFIPFTYTLGVRYTNPYQNARDFIVRGNIPLWCQTLFITECMRQLPILPNTTRTGLLPFLKDMEFQFTTVPQLYPEMTVIFERFAMELCDPQMLWHNKDSRGNTWEDMQRKILGLMAFCDIPDRQAAIITSVANQWAMSQGLTSLCQ